MTLSPLGINYICKNFGDTSLCCVKTGLSWYTTVDGVDYPETGGTSMIVGRLALGLCSSLTMTSPPRGAFTKAELDAANESAVTITDSREITYHDEPTEDQWCFIPCSAHTDQATCVDVYQCFWWNNACHDVAPTCEELNNETECLGHGCVWYNNSCHEAVVCEEINNQTECVGHGCFWYNNSCHSTVVCESILIQTECEAHGCYWWNGACHSAAPTCDGLNNQVDCLRWDCFWYNGMCHAAVICENINNQTECLGHGCFWYNGACHSVDQPNLCYWIDAQGGPTGLTVPNVYTILDSYSTSTPPPGYTFVPTVMNVYGVLDYYLGYDADALTGCNFY